jgi:hypothetical protein
LKKYDLYDSALIIGTDESTEYFTGKIRLSCTRQQLEDNMRKTDYKSADYFLFSGTITKEDAKWARTHGVLAVGVVNAWSFRDGDLLSRARSQADSLMAAGVKYFQVDSIFEPFFRNK